MNTRVAKDQESWLDVDSLDLYQNMLERFAHHKSVAEDGVHRSFRLGWWLAMLIPIGSALLTLLVGFAESLPKYVLPTCGFLLTTMAVVNSTLKPSEKFPGLSVMVTLLDEWKLDLDVRIKQVDHGDQERVFDLLREKSRQLSEIGKDVSRRMIPRLLPSFRSSEKEGAVADEVVN